MRSSSCQSARPRRPVFLASVAATPATCGVAMLVPLLTPYEPFATGTVEYVATPGAAMFTSPPLPLSADARERCALQRLVERRDREHRRAVRGSADGRPSAVARRGHDERPGVQRRGCGLLVVREVRLADGDRRAQRHRDHVGALLDGPLDAGQDPAARAAALVAQHLADDQPRAVRDAVAPLRARRRLRAGGRARAVRAVRVAVLHRLPGDERLARDDATREVGVAQVDARVEHRDPDLRARPTVRSRGSAAPRARPSGPTCRWRCRRTSPPRRPRRPPSRRRSSSYPTAGGASIVSNGYT